MPRIGLISDTHGLLRPEAVAFLRGSDRIIHAGDIGRAEVLAELSKLSPVTAVRGNNDRGPWADTLHETQRLAVGDVAIYLLHDIARLDIDPAAAGIQIVICGHSHKPAVDRRNGVLYVNPGSAGPRRFKLPVCAGEVLIVEESIDVRLVELSLSDPKPSGAGREFLRASLPRTPSPAIDARA